MLLVGLPVFSVWEKRDSVKPAHAVFLLTFGLLLGAIAGFAFAQMRHAGAGWGGLGLAMIMFGAGALASILLSAGIMASLMLALRDEREVEARRQFRRHSGEPERPSLQPLSAREISTRLVVPLASMTILCIVAAVHTLRSASVPNYLRLLGLYRGPNDPRELSFAVTPAPYALQLGIVIIVAVGCAVWAIVVYMRRLR